MAFPRRQAAVVGVYTTEQARGLERTMWSLELEAIKGALDEAGLSPTQVDGLIPMAYNTPLNLHMQWAEQLGGRPISYMGVGNGSSAVAKAAVAIESGMANVVVIFFANANNPNGPRQIKMPDKAPRVEDWMFMVHGCYMSVWYALWTQLYLHEFGCDRDIFAQYPCKMRENAMLKPDSLMGSRGPITIEDVYNSRMIASPLHLFECPLDNDGGYAMVVTSKEIARDCKTDPVWILGGAEATHTDGYQTITAPWNNPEGAAVKRSTEIAFDMAGITHYDIDVAGLYDCFAVTVARNLEEMGFCKLGEG
ncbi:MAG: thiolase family protein, partial [Sphingomonadaceae bacterium]|nr:thiolase family protein [Sphingomonadaceae bacterium]